LKYSIVLPTFNEQDNLSELYNRVSSAMSRLSQDYEIIFVDDGSTDQTRAILRGLHSQDRHVLVVRLRKNAGQSSALAAGFKNVSGEIIISMDADLQNDPSDIPKLLEKLEEGYDVVCGWRRRRDDPYLSKKLPSKVSNLLARRLSGVSIHDFGCTFRAYKRQVVRDLVLYGELHRFVPALAAWKGYTIGEVEVAHLARKHGKSKYGVGRVFRGGLDLVTAFLLERYLSRPMHLFGVFGLVVTLFGFVLLSYLVVLRVLYNVAIGERPLLLLSGLMVLVGLQSAIIGVIGEMLTRYQIEGGGKTFYDVEELLGSKD